RRGACSRQRLAGQAGAGRDFARRDELVRLGLRAVAARKRRSSAPARGGRRGSARPAALRTRAVAGGGRGTRGELRSTASGADARSGPRGALSRGRNRVGKTSQNRRKGGAIKPRAGRRR